MDSIRTKLSLLFIFSSITICELRSQNVAINASGVAANLSALLDLDGVTSFTGPNGYKGLLIPRMTNAQRTGILTLPAAAQGLFVYQTDGVEGFYYNISTTTTPSWMYIAPSSSGWSTIGNSGTTASASAIGAAANNNFIGTTDGKDFVLATNNLERMRISTAGNIGVGTIAPTATALVTINPTVNALKNGIDMTMSGATSTATGLNITTANSNVNGILVTQSSGALASSMYNIGAVLSTANIVSGYNAYRNGSGLSYGIYAINGTNAVYATNANTWASFLQGRTVISSESSPTSPVGVDLEVRNTTTGGAAPSTVSMRQTTAVTVSGTVLANLNFGDNHQTGPEAQIQVIRGTSGGVGDLPTDMIFSTTPNASAVLTERMRIDNVGFVGIGNTTPNTSLDVNGAYSARFTVAAAAAALVIPNNVSLYRISATAGVQANALSVAVPQNGQFMTIINEDGDAATFAGFTIPAAGAVSGVGSFVYSLASLAWSSISLYPPAGGGGASWNLTGNAATTPSTSAIGTAILAGQNYIGTTDVKDLVIGTNNLERMRVTSAGNIGIGIAPILTSHIIGSFTGAFNGLSGSQGILYTATSTNAATNNNNHTGAQFQGKAASASKVKNIYGVEGDAIMGASTATGLATGQVVGVFGTASGLSGIASTTVGEIYGVLGTPVLFDPLNSTHMAGIASQLSINSGSPTTTNAYLFRGISNAGDISSGTITNLYGINIPVLGKTAPAVVTTAYGAYINTPTAGVTNYGAYIGGTVGIGTTTPITALDVNGAYSARFSTAAPALAVVIPNNVSLFRLSLVVGVQANALSVATPQDGQFLTIINEDGDAATFGGYTISAVAAGNPGIASFVYSGSAAAWRLSSSAAGGGGGWGLTGNAGTDGGTANFFGTTDAKALSIRVNNLKSGLIDPIATSGTFFGYQSGKNVAAGAANINSTGFGYQALSVVAAFGTHNSAFGKMALTLNTDGFSNTALGSLAMQANVHGAQNTAVGVNALGATVGDGGGLGEGNTAVGFQTLLNNTTGSYNTAVGWYAFNLFGNRNNCMTLGADQFNFCQPTANNQIWVGDNQITSIKGQVAFTTYSDGRVKNNVQEDVPGLVFINELRPVTYNYDMEKELEISGGHKPTHKDGKYDIEKIKFSGFIAQEVETAANKIGYDFSGVDKPVNGKGLYGLRYSEFVVPLVKSIQELSTENDDLKTKVEKLSEDNKEMKIELDKIKLLLEANNKK